MAPANFDNGWPRVSIRQDGRSAICQDCDCPEIVKMRHSVRCLLSVPRQPTRKRGALSIDSYQLRLLGVMEQRLVFVGLQLFRLFSLISLLLVLATCIIVNVRAFHYIGEASALFLSLPVFACHQLTTNKSSLIPGKHHISIYK